MKDLEGRIALVTGASRGIGRAIAMQLAEAGADLAVNYQRQAEQAAQVCAEIRAVGQRAVAVAADVADSAQVQQLIQTVQQQLGPVDILVNNAGITRPQPLEEITEQDWDDVLATNLKSAFLVTQAVLPGMRSRRWGRIVNVSSVAAQLGGVVGPHYAASKAGMHGLTHGYACLLAAEGITVNAVAPALIDTDMLAAVPRAKAEIIPVGRFGTADETAQAVVMLARNGYITGQTVNVNGGWYMS
jgi:3-oxoacyl-[acyl-carrier protein] reductase